MRAVAPPARRVAVPLHPVQRTPHPAPGDVLHTLSGKTMGTRWTAKLFAGPAACTDGLQEAIEDTLALLVAQMSQWEEASDLSRFNTATAGSWHCLPPEFYRVLEYALGVARDSGGAYDPSIGKLVEAWGFGAAAERGRVPPAEHLKSALAHCGWSRVQLDPERRAACQPGGVHLDLSSVAKGYAVDRVSEVVRASGFASFLVEIGGELRGEGLKPDGMPWWVLLENPPAESAVLPETVIALHGLAVATSGSSEHFFDTAGRRYSHTIDPRTGWPIAHDLVSVTVVHRQCMHADALATALTVLGPEAGMVHARRLGLAARFVSAGSGAPREQLTPRLAAMLG